MTDNQTDREALARIIDPWAMGDAENDMAERTDQLKAAEKALAKADQWLSAKRGPTWLEGRVASADDALREKSAVKQELLQHSPALDKASTAPSGWKLVPVEPTEAMNKAGEMVGDYPWDGKKPSRIYTTMLAAAPALAQTEKAK